MNKDLQELKQQLDEWITKYDANQYDKQTETEDYYSALGSLTSLLIVREWVVNKLIKNIK